ncbi:MAG: hypothetical protein A3A96_01185 [Candidatus Zambryskibacteria bacterium RIFCSPLOWO2_01_FULL_39_39]|uniref:Second mannosyl transferase n=1 Tax=Candidatus Zambryskibacteria bacterium RIFCSPLOWO2_01_FULL_39_39 TaxID=1802758 RepID=A0A1G2U0N1_9BACT|nr:MAG: Second mannosyl transferase [Parcubacteria group bacterium GW2011_GWA1_38_7]OHA87516.1 MAG: hypothetical protein A2644_04195 [Candidatus Zambryskibacteria bacterium RIFCSPHIGHO2_01_FULL_39_63]OHA95044.1 MAG: hypothetical protein A3B88_03105 [Candidatus Zambryskibacteria bacterium RIFCSPHIGHO2_02_FULL_39_19]OHA98164.1 MAG: hypothetical protein A3F20_03915 [Candidatus Zambryskibacteria bacterium RIFCSPHIGHO2_12_FULL_39_21]OHB02470.1 MAG: hypothetical protein A3A96_01185 [Candidatus Zambry
MQNKKKILFIITKGNFGGAQRYVYDLATSLPKSEFEAVVACGEGDLLPNKLGEVGIKTIKINNLVREIKTFNEFSVCKELVALIRTERPDIIHLNSSKMGGIGSVAGRIASILEKNYKPKIIFTSHGWGFYEKHRPLLFRLFFYLSHWLTILLCHQTIAVSEKTKKDIAWLPFIKNKIKVIHNGIEDFKLLPKKEAALILAKTDKEKTIIFSLSELHPNKGLDVAIRGIALLPENIRDKIAYYIAGDGEEKESLQKLARDFGVLTTVHFLGFVEDAKKLLSGSNIFLFPSRTENLPYAILEAGTAELPIIATSVGGIPEIIRDMQNGILVHPRNPKEIAEAILYLLDHPENRKEFGEEIKKTVINFFSLEKMLEETEKIYKLP